MSSLPKKKKINSYEKCLAELPKTFKYKKIVFNVVQIFIFIYNYCTVLVNGSNFARFLHLQTKEFFDNDLFRDDSFTKMLTFVFMILLTISIRSAEYLKFPSLFSTLAIIISLLVFWSMNLFETGLKNLDNVEPFTWSGAFPLVSSQVYSIESVGTLLTIRQAMANPQQINRVVVTVFLLSLCLFLLNGWSFMMSYLSPVEMAFYYFKGTNYLVLVLKVCFYLTLPATICITMFTLFTIFESFEPLKDTLGVEHEPEPESVMISTRNYKTSFGLSMKTEINVEEYQKSLLEYQKSNQMSKDSNMTREMNLRSNRIAGKNNEKRNSGGFFKKICGSKFLKIAGMRCLLGCILFFPFMLEINEYFLILLTGSLISPCLGFIFPIIAYNYYFREELKTKKVRLIFNWVILVIGVGLNMASFVYTIRKGD